LTIRARVCLLVRGQVNLKTAKALALDNSVIAALRADEVIECLRKKRRVNRAALAVS
jgi:hypothetical protein